MSDLYVYSFVVSCDKKSSDHIPDKRLKFTYENNIGKKVTSDIYDNYAFIIVEDDRTYNAKYYFYNVINSTIIEKNNINEFIKLLAIIPKGKLLVFILTVSRLSEPEIMQI